jgi:beta-mannanase
MRSSQAPRHVKRSPRPPRHLPAGSGPRHVRSSRPPVERAGRPRRALTAIVLVLGLVGTLALTAAAQRSPVDASLEPPSTAWLGGWVKGDSWALAAQQGATLQLEEAIGRKLDIGHSWVPWGSGLGRLPAWHVSEGRIPLISFGNGGSTREVAAGQHDAYLASLATSIRGLGRPVLLRYGWEMDGRTRQYWVVSAADYQKAWRHVRALFAAQGVRASWVWSPNADAFAGARGGVDQYYPGDDQVDWIGTDGYNWNTCNGRSHWEDFATIFRSFYAWGSARNKPLMISETGTVEDPLNPGRKAAWFDDAARTLARSMPRVKAVVYFDESKQCDWRPNTSQTSMAGFTRFARDPFFGPVSSPPSSLPPAPTSSSSTTTTRPPATTSTTRPPTSTTAPAPTPGGTNDILVPSSGALWGAFAYPLGMSSAQAISDLEAGAGRRMDIVHYYHLWDQDFPSATERAWADGGRILYLNWKPRSSSGGTIAWRSVADGSQDAQITRTARNVQSLGHKLFLTFHHEPEDEVGSQGSAADYVAAWRHVHDTFARLGVDNVVWVWNMTGYVQNWASLYDQLYPGDGYVDWIATDQYNWYGCNQGAPWISFQQSQQPFYDWAQAHHPSKPIMLGEWGTEAKPGDPSAKADWIRAAVNDLKNRFPKVKAAVYFNRGGAADPVCDWRLETSPEAMAAFAAAGQDTYVNTR